MTLISLGFKIYKQESLMVRKASKNLDEDVLGSFLVDKSRRRRTQLVERSQ